MGKLRIVKLLDPIQNNVTVAGITVQEEDGSPSVTNVTELNVANGALINNGLNSVSLDYDSRYINADGDTMTGVLTTAGLRRAVAIKSTNYTLTSNDEVVVFTSTATATLPVASGSGQTFRIVCRSGATTIAGSGSDTVKGESSQVLTSGEDLLLTDTGVWE